ncbi:hypothetical protein EV180_003380 [Coemansia sp. RSA 518]|nr:hypothetical protein EV180_003380 [Coemansia sp. RSA 518]
MDCSDDGAENIAMDCSDDGANNIAMDCSDDGANNIAMDCSDDGADKHTPFLLAANNATKIRRCIMPRKLDCKVQTPASAQSAGGVSTATPAAKTAKRIH